jgi:restriction system protein
MAQDSRNSALRPPSASRKESELEIVIGIKQFAHDQVMRHIAERFSGHDLARLVAAVLTAENFQVEVAGPGPDGGVDILASKGMLGFDGPHICVQVKSSKHPEDVVTLRALQGTMKNFKADQGLLVAWGGFTKALIREARQSHFQLRLWSAQELVDAVYRSYDSLPEEIQVELRLEKVWVLTTEDMHNKQSRQICSLNRE